MDAIGAMLLALRHRDVTGGRWNGKTGDARCVAGQQMVDAAHGTNRFSLMETWCQGRRGGRGSRAHRWCSAGIVPSKTLIQPKIMKIS